jgi:hypothetical protein
VTVTVEAIEYALDRLSALAAVNFARPKSDKQEAIKLVWEGVGVLDPDDLNTRIEKLTTSEGPFLMGVLFGLYLAQYNEL